MKKDETIALNSAIITKETIANIVSNSLALAESGEKSYIELITLGAKLENINNYSNNSNIINFCCLYSISTFLKIMLKI